MTHRRKELWQEMEDHVGAWYPEDQAQALDDLAELFDRVEALEASLTSAVKVAEEERGHTSRVLTRNGELEAENAALTKDNAKMRAMLAGNKDLIEGLGLPMNSIYTEVQLELARREIALKKEVAALKADALNAEAKGWRDAVSLLQYCEANWYQDCKSDVERKALQDATKNLTEELIDASPGDWLGTEWKSAKAWMDQVAALKAQAVEREWQSIESAPKSTSRPGPGGTHIVTGVYLLGLCPEDGATPESCIDVIWWEPHEGKAGKWFGGDALPKRPTHWMPLPAPPSTTLSKEPDNG